MISLHDLPFILASAAIFSGILLFLVVAVLVSHYLLRAAGAVQIDVNEQLRFEAQYGQKLLSALVEYGVFVPAACGGRGACGQCRVIIKQGASPLTAVEATYISKKQADQGERLACAQIIKRPMHIRIPERLMKTQRKRFRVIHNRLVSCFLTEVELAPVDGMALSFVAGDYVLLEAPPYEVAFSSFSIPPVYQGEWEQLGLLSLESTSQQTEVRAYSIANAPIESENIRLVVRIALPPQHIPETVPPGLVSSYVFSLRVDDEVTLAGPYGDFHLQSSNLEKVFIGGGAGVAPLRSMIREMLLHQKEPRPLSFWYGARDQRQLCYQQEFEVLAKEYPHFSYHCALSEPIPTLAWEGSVGFVHRVVFEQFLSVHPDPANMEYYLCGPPVMNSAVITMLRELGVSDERIFVDEFGG